jgi:hypothetical protein
MYREGFPFRLLLPDNSAGDYDNSWQKGFYSLTWNPKHDGAGGGRGGGAAAIARLTYPLSELGWGKASNEAISTSDYIRSNGKVANTGWMWEEVAVSHFKENQEIWLEVLMEDEVSGGRVGNGVESDI